MSAILVIVMMMMTIRVAPGSCKWKPAGLLKGEEDIK